jgi:hypothetical protein
MMQTTQTLYNPNPKATTNVGHNKVSLTKAQVALFRSKLPDDAYLKVETKKDVLFVDLKQRYGANLVTGEFIPYKVKSMFEAPIVHWKKPNLYLGAIVSRKLYPDRRLSEHGKIQLIIADGDEVLFGDASDRPPNIDPMFLEMLK